MYSLVIIDDEVELLEGLSTYFPWETIGFTVSASFTDARTAIPFCKEHPVDVVLTDIRMPFISGLDLIQELKKSKSDLLFCVMSAYDSFEYARRAIAYGVQDYLVKPATFEEIQNTFFKIRSLLDEKTIALATESGDTHYAPLIATAHSILHKRFGSCTLQSVASELGINSSYLSRLFKEETGRNFQDILFEVKMEHACRMLTGKIRYKNKDIAKAVGYQDTQNFCRAFKARFGSSPQQYRKEQSEA